MNFLSGLFCRRAVKSSENAGVKILFLLNHLGSGGAEGSLALTLPALVDGGVEPIVGYFETESAKEVHREKLESHSSVVAIPGRTRLERVFALRDLVKREEPQIVHSALMESNLISRFACVRLDALLVNSLVSMSYTAARFRAPKTRKVKHRLLQVVDAVTGLLLVDHFHSVNQAVKDEAVRSLLIPPSRISVVHRGRPDFPVLSSEKRSVTRATLGLKDDAFVVFTAGRQSYIKGQMDLLVAFHGLLKRFPDVRLVIAGRQGDYTDELMKYVRDNNLERYIKLLGHRDDVAALLGISDLFVFPSHLEGIGGAMIEAMAAGLPVISSDIPGLRETLGQNPESSFVAPGDSGGLLCSMVEMKEKPMLREELGRKNRARYELQFKVQPNAEKLLELYRKLAM